MSYVDDEGLGAWDSPEQYDKYQKTIKGRWPTDANHKGDNMTDALQVINTDTGELTELPESALAPFANASMLRLTKEESAALTEPIPVEQIAIRPDGFAYWDQVHYRERLNRVLGLGQWAFVELSTNYAEKEKMMYVKGALFIRGNFVGQAIGEQEYFGANGNQTYATAYEAAKSNAVVRCCKDLSMASELWDKSFVEKWKNEHCILVEVDTPKKGKQNQWRKRGAEPFYKETKIVFDPRWKNKPPANPPPAPKTTPPAPKDGIDWSKPDRTKILETITKFATLSSLNTWVRDNSANVNKLPAALQTEVKTAVTNCRKIIKETTE